MKIVPAIALLGAVLAGCSGDDDGPTIRTTSTTTTDGAAPAALDGTSSCVDETGDGVAGDGLATVQLLAQDQTLSIAWSTEAPISGPSVSFYLNLFGVSYQIGLRSIDGDVFRFVADTSATDQVNLTTAFSIHGTVASLVVPQAEIERLEAPFEYSAVMTVDGADVDTCDGIFPST